VVRFAAKQPTSAGGVAWRQRAACRLQKTPTTGELRMFQPRAGFALNSRPWRDLGGSSGPLFYRYPRSIDDRNAGGAPRTRGLAGSFSQLT